MTDVQPSSDDTLITKAIYLLYLGSFVVGITWLIAIVLNYIKRDDVAGTILESHFKYQIRTFWFSVLWGVIGFILTFFVVGLFVLWANAVWIIYRNIKGLLRLMEKKEMYRDYQ